jgi:hypothetical protein
MNRLRAWSTQVFGRRCVNKQATSVVADFVDFTGFDEAHFPM